MAARRLKPLKQLQATGQCPFGMLKVRKLITEGKFPKPAILGSGRAGHLWDEDEVGRAIERLVAEAPKEIPEEELQRLRRQAAKAVEAKAEKRANRTAASTTSA